MRMFNDPADREALIGFIRSHCIRHAAPNKPFTLASGAQSWVKYDLDPLLEDAQMGTVVGRAMARWIDWNAQDTTLIGGPASGGPRVTNLILPHLRTVRAEKFSIPKVEGSRELADTVQADARTVDLATPHKPLIVDDVATRGTSIFATDTALSTWYLNARHALVILDREEGARYRLQEKSIQLTSLLTRSDIDPQR